MTPERTYFLFKNDIRNLVVDTINKMTKRGDMTGPEILAETDFRVQQTYKITLAQYREFSGN